MPDFIALLNEVKDPRQATKTIYPLTNILFIGICAIFCGAEAWEDMALFAQCRFDWFSQYIDMSDGVPSKYTIRRVFSLLDPPQIGELTMRVITSLFKQGSPAGHIAIDGKTLRGNQSKAKEIKPLQIVSAWCESQGISMAEVAVDRKSNEITAIPELLDLINIKGSTISIDAMGTQKAIAEKIINNEAHYVLALKGNQGNLHQEVKNHMETEGTCLENLVKDYFEKSHGRVVRRRYFACELPESLNELSFPGMESIIATETISNNVGDSKVSAEWRYYISSHKPSEEKLPEYIRNHWGIENKLHWVLDVHLNDDADRKLNKNAVDNISRIKRLAVNLVRKNDSANKKSVRLKLKQLQWDENYLLNILLGKF
ncbi:Transposase (plasmid) [Piscirickettsia salmonis]|uniref:ISAs1 family transposase n=3 Tax=Piscirickettsia salmonis TaxID=1238 RepID=UPI0012B94730|nr:ISAs1 family transposase [Piscirickettsia salmonis]QGP48960.1 Transposase [Piscirickettsia salmonis]QGP49305.1 Transposase [Piscirickettsia salmonis]QGP49426.1 Transposase [Piscirickettsia salmonis]QGP49472.1 Transposase [Piscirickettsia salmonis]QGP49942.1 Transposase [Piscirickettsia salmonis]